MSWSQTTITLKPRSRGFHLIDNDILTKLPQLSQLKIGLLHLFIQHTSASLTINENADPTVRMDMESHFNQFVPERQPYYRHDYEGDDDMPAHIKSSLTGHEITIPITSSELNIGTWQGIYLCEFRNSGGPRKILASVYQ